MSQPLIRLDPDGASSFLSYSIPEPQSYSGSHLVELGLDPELFRPHLREPPRQGDPGALRPRPAVGSIASETTVSRFVGSTRSRGADLRRFAWGEVSAAGLDPSMAARLAELDPDEVAAAAQSGYRLNLYRSLYGTAKHNYVPVATQARPRLFLVESYRLSSFLGRYGAGRTLRTFTLLPGEKTRVSVKTFTRTKSTAREASSILDSLTQESADEFEQQVQAEQSDKQAYNESFEFNVDASAKASWGFGSAKLSTGLKRSTSSAREEFSKNLSSALQKHSAKASAKREVQVNTSYEVEVESGEETSIEREIANINLSRTLNFVFRQMNQEFITLLHLTDVKVGFFNGFEASRQVVPLSRVAELLDAVLVDDDAARDRVQDQILEQIEVIHDYQDEPHQLVERKQLLGVDGAPLAEADYLRVRRDLVSRYEHPISGQQFEVPGVIMAASTTVMRTEGTIAEAVMGEGLALDPYARQLQEIEVNAREARKDRERAQAEVEALRRAVVRDADAQRAAVFRSVMCPCESLEDDAGTDD